MTSPKAAVTTAKNIKLQKSEKNPILSPNKNNSWENLAVCNPGVWYEDGVYTMLYRAAGDDKEHYIRFGKATSKDGVHFERASDQPVLGPSIDGPDTGGIEDPRIVKFGNEYYITYAYRPHPPGQYWTFAHDVINLPEASSDSPAVYRKNIANSGLLLSTDLTNFRRLGRITSSNLDDRDVILFPEKINGKFAMLHRPKEWIGPEYGVDKPAVWIRFSDDLMVWEEPSHLLFAGINGTWEEKIGGSTPPLRTDDGWLVIYHGVENGGLGYYRAGAVLLDLEDPTKVIGRLEDWIMEPEHDYEIDGFYKGCVFPTGNMIVGDTLQVYYGCADKHIGLATCDVNELLQQLKAS